MIANLRHDRRGEPRLKFAWDAQLYLTDARTGTPGRMVDLNSEGAALLLDVSKELHPGQPVELRLTYPRVTDGQFHILHHCRWGTVLRTDFYNPALKRVVLRFQEPLLDRPGVQNEYPAH